MLAKAATSLLDPRDASRLKFEPHPEGHGLPINPAGLAGFKIPYFDLDGGPTDAYRFRMVQDAPSKGWASVTRQEKPRRYTQPAGANCGVYFPPLLPGKSTWREVAKDPEVPIVVTEGELKSACATKHGVPTIGLGGVYNWKSKKNEQEFLPVLKEFAWEKRRVYVCFDSDIASNPLVLLAASQLACVLAEHGARVFLVKLPPAPDGGKQGLDDYIYAGSPEKFKELLGDAEPIGKGVQLVQLSREYAFCRATKEVVHLATGRADTVHEFVNASERNRTYVDFVPSADGKSTRTVKMYAAKEWIESAYRLEVSRVVYEPSCPDVVTPAGEYNDWSNQGWGCEPVKGSVRPWERLFQRVFGSLTPDQQEWVRRWFAYPVQNPGAKLATAIVAWGPQGTGKSAIAESMRAIYGKNYGTVTKDQLDGQFNEWLRNKQFILSNELALGSKRELSNFLKEVITRKTVSINVKNRRPYDIRDCVNYFFTSNHPDAVYLEHDDRRFLVCEVERAEFPPEEAEAYWNWLEREGGAAALHHHLLREVDCTDFRPHAPAPLTSAKAEMISAGMGDLEDWVLRLSSDPDGVLPRERNLYTTEDLLAIYDPDKKGSVRAVGMSKALNARAAAGGRIVSIAKGQNNAVINGQRVRLWGFRDPSVHKKLGVAAAKALYEQERAARPAAARKFEKRVN